MQGVGRLELWARLGRILVAEGMFDAAALRAQEHEWRERLTRTDYRGAPWFSSLRGSEFPGDDSRFCPRKALYGLMGFPNEKPASRMLTGTAIVGSAAEEWNVLNLEFDGRLLAASEGRDKSKHIGFIDNDHWLTGSPDFVVLPPFWNRPHIIETKTKDANVVVEMKNLQRSYEAKHERQTRAYIGAGNRISPLLWSTVVVCRHTWRLALRAPAGDGEMLWCGDHQDSLECLIEIELEPIRSGSLIYMGRDRPHLTSEYVFEHDERWFQAGLAKLAQVRAHFEAGTLPPHPFGGKQWAAEPCKYCDHKKKTCKPDHQGKVDQLAESNGVGFAREVYGYYDPERVREQVLDRWRGKSGVGYTLPQEIEQRERVHG